MNTKKLYHFLMSNECHLYRQGDDIKSFVCVNFRDFDDFIKIIKSSDFEEIGLEATIKNGYMVVDIEDLIGDEGEELIEYKECFGDEWDVYFKKE